MVRALRDEKITICSLFQGMRIPSSAKLKLHDFSFDDNELDDYDTLKVRSAVFFFFETRLGGSGYF